MSQTDVATASQNTKQTASESETAVYAALIGDILVALTKTIAAVWTGSAAMASEAVHSFVDTLNELLLLYGIHRSVQKPDHEHPLGYGREVYFWSFIVALLIFAFGSGFAIYQGANQFLQPRPIESPVVNYVVLGLAFVFEGSSWLVSLRQFKRVKGELGYLQAIKLSKDPPSFITLFEDSAALLGIAIAAAGTIASAVFEQPRYDGAASVCIGLILAVISVFLANESKSLLIGEQAKPAVARSILEIANTQPAIMHANGLVTVQSGPTRIIVMPRPSSVMARPG
jgi:cation diffusion facilitator family transporter